jgi:hypothetical protein
MLQITLNVVRQRVKRLGATVRCPGPTCQVPRRQTGVGRPLGGNLVRLDRIDSSLSQFALHPLALHPHRRRAPLRRRRRHAVVERRREQRQWEHGAGVLRRAGH